MAAEPTRIDFFRHGESISNAGAATSDPASISTHRTRAQPGEANRPVVWSEANAHRGLFLSANLADRRAIDHSVP